MWIGCLHEQHAPWTKKLELWESGVFLETQQDTSWIQKFLLSEIDINGLYIYAVVQTTGCQAV